MLTTSHLNASLDENDLSTFLIIPFDSVKSQNEYVQLKMLPDGTMYFVNPEIQQVNDKIDLPDFENEILDVGTEQPCNLPTPVAATSVIQFPEKLDSATHLPIAPDTSVDVKFKCIKCTKSLGSIAEYKDHLKWHKLQKKFRCEHCSAGYKIENNLKIHNALIHPADSLSSCPICGVSLKFQRAASLKSHLMVHLVEEVNSCDECDAEIEKEDDYAEHMLKHVSKVTEEPSSLTCSHCEIEFQSPKHLKHHISDHAKAWKFFKKKRVKRPVLKDKKYNCSICSKSFIKQSLLERHERIHTGVKPFKCPICDQCFTQKGTVQMHMAKHTGTKPFACTLCPARFNQKGNLRVHIKKTHTVPDEGQKMFKCPHCSCIFKRIASLNGHVTRAHLKYQCPEENLIDNVMKNLNDLKENAFNPYITLMESTTEGVEKKYTVQLKKIGDVRWYVCSYCSKMCKKPSDLIRHIRVHTKERPFTCKICKKSFSLKATLVSHMNTHSVLKNVKCKVCNAAFSSNRILSIHMKKHDYEKLSKWQCVTCDVLFDEFEKALQHKMAQDEPHTIQSVINRVMKQPLYQTAYGNLTFKAPRPKVPNTGSETSASRPFHCTVCDASFAKKIDLKRHMKHHDGDKRFKCDQCPKIFITSYRLREHINSHNNIKNYACKTCNKRFGTSTNLRRHMITHNNLRPYMCPYCFKHFQTLDLSRRHIKSVHKKDVLSKIDAEVKKLTESEDNNNDLSQATTVIVDNSKQTMETNPVLLPHTDIVQPVAPEVPPEAAVLNPESIQDPNAGFQTFYVNLDDLQLIDNTGMNLSSLVENVGAPDNFQIPTNDHSEKDHNQNNPVLMYTNPVQSTDSLNLTLGPPETIFDGNAVVQASVGINETRNIFDDASILCMHCNRMFSSFVYFQKHACTANVSNEKERNTGIETSSEKTEAIREEKDESVRDEDPQQFVCEKQSMEQKVYKKHSKTNSAIECGKCKQRFSDKSAYLEHMASHKVLTGAKTHHCVFCLKEFKKFSDLERHVRTHTGEKPFGCDICDKKFSLKSTLQSHVRTHDPNHKQFGCDICNNFFTSKSSLKIHMTIHTGQMSYACSICKQKFRTLGAKKTHETLGHRQGSKRKNKKNPANHLSDILQTLSSDILPEQGQENEIQNNQAVPEYVPLETLNLVMGNNNEQNLDLPSEIVNLDMPPEAILSNIPEDHLPVDPTNLLQQLQMSDMVLTANETDVVPSLILDDVSFLDLNPATNNLQIISLPEADGGVTISIKENADSQNKVQPKQYKDKSKSVDCDICHNTYASKDGLRKHKKNVHGDKKKFGCQKCGEKFETKEKLRKHDDQHSEEFACALCTLKFDGPIGLQEHIDSFHQECDMTKEQTSALLNLKLDLPSATIDEPLFNNLFLLKKY